MNPSNKINKFSKLLRRLIKLSGGSDHDFWKLYSYLVPSVKNVKKFKNIGTSKRCFIIGGGPSLKKCNPVFLKNEITFGVNGIFLIEDWLGFLPDFYVVEDNLVVEDRKNEISELVGPKKFYSKAYKDLIHDKGDHTLLNVIYDYSQYSDFPEFSLNSDKCLWVGGTVIYLCLQLAFYMGFEKVYLIGMDHNYHKPKDVLTNGTEWLSQSDDPNHFHPDYFGKGKRWHDPCLERMELAYKRAREIYEANGRQILNASIGGHLEIFDRVDYYSLFKD